MRISDWSSDVCSSDLIPGTPRQCDARLHLMKRGAVRLCVGTWFKQNRRKYEKLSLQGEGVFASSAPTHRRPRAGSSGQIGRAHVGTPVTNAHLICHLLHEIKQNAATHKTYKSNQ